MLNKGSIKTLAVLFFIVVTTANASAQDTLAYWSFNEGSGSIATEKISHAVFSLKSHWQVAEWAPGIKQTALRTDGYSEWAEGYLPQTLPAGGITFSAWVAPEVYPVADAAFWSSYDSLTTAGAWVGMDKYGRLKLAFNKSGTLLTYTADSALVHYRWNFIVVNINAANGSVTAYLNTVKIVDATFAPGSVLWPPPGNTRTFIGKLPLGQMNGLYPENSMNAIIDEAGLFRTSLSEPQINNLYTTEKPALLPDMSTPKARFAADFLRPKYHPIPASNWCNESHGLTFYNGMYHLFYQKNGNGCYLFQQNWGHLESPDLVTWKEVAPALWPSPGWDNYGVWSGHAIIDDNNTPQVFYSGVDGVKAGIGKAMPSTQDLLQWRKINLNPVIPSAPSSYPNKDFRDPYLFKENGTWYMITGSGLQSPNVGTVFLYRSVDLNSWQFIGPMYSGNTAYSSEGIFWEMPVFFKFGNKYVLLVNRVPQNGIPAKSLYFTGAFASDHFLPGNAFPKDLELINWLLSPSVNYDAAGRVTAIGIIPDQIPSSEQYKRGYANLFSLPRVWQLQNDSLLQCPHPSLTKLRSDSTTFAGIAVAPAGTGYLAGSKGFQLEITASISKGSSSQAGLIVGKNADNSEYTRIYYDYSNNAVVIDRSHSSTNTAVNGDVQSSTLYLDNPALPIDWRVFIDGSVIEVFVNNRYAFAARCYPANANSNNIDLFAMGGTALASAVVYNLQPSSMLPVKWISFNVTKLHNESVTMQWQVSDETNVSRYDVQRSGDGEIFTTIGLREPAQKNSLIATYTATDLSPAEGLNYYRINQVDNDGKYTYSLVRAIDLSAKKDEEFIQLLQNPVHGTLTFKAVKGNLRNLSVSLYDISQKKILHKDFSDISSGQIKQIPVANLSAGIYVLSVSSSGAQASYKIIVD